MTTSQNSLVVYVSQLHYRFYSLPIQLLFNGWMKANWQICRWWWWWRLERRQRALSTERQFTQEVYPRTPEIQDVLGGWVLCTVETTEMKHVWVLDESDISLWGLPEVMRRCSCSVPARRHPESRQSLRWWVCGSGKTLHGWVVTGSPNKITCWVLYPSWIDSEPRRMTTDEETWNNQSLKVKRSYREVQ